MTRPASRKPRARRALARALLPDPTAHARTETHNNLLAFQLKVMRVPAFEREYAFAKRWGRKFRADFAWPERRLLVECNGGLWMRGGGAHSRPANIKRDIEKAQWAIRLGWRLLPVTTDEVTSGAAVALIAKVVGSIPPAILQGPRGDWISTTYHIDEEPR